MNVLFVIYTPKSPYSALYNSCCRLVTFLDKQGHRATILAPQDFPILSRLHARWFPLLYPFWVARWLICHGKDYDLVVFHSYAGWVVNMLRKFIPAYRQLRTITQSHGLEPLYFNAFKGEMEKTGQPLRFRYRLIHGALIPWLIRLSCRRSDRILCLNRNEAAYLVNNNWGQESRISVVPHGVSQEFFIRRQYASEVRRLLFVGQWLEMKGIRYLVEAFGVLARNAPELEIHCVGTLLEEEKVLADFPQELQNRVVVRPRVNREELVTTYQDADLFVFPTLSEGFSSALLEAMATALPIVATPVGATSDLLKDRVNALLVPKGNAMALANSVRRLLDDATLQKQLGNQAQATAAKYRLEYVCKERVALFEDTLAMGC